MAGNKVNTKTKGKEDKGKANKVVPQTNEDNEDLDFAVLRKPIPTSITGFAQARKIFDLATEELKDLLSNECDILYECKVCRNIFRSLANFISHKRVYCKEKFNSSVHGHFIKSNSTANEILKIKRSENEYKESLKAKNETNSSEAEDGDERIPLTKDLTAIYEKITKSKPVINSNCEPQVVLKKIPSSTVAVFQNMKFEEQSSDNMRAQVKELDDILSRDQAVLQSDGTFAIESSEADRDQDTDNVIQISDDEENDDSGVLKCKICDLQFSTQKTLKFHMKYKHLESRLVYPCPDCLEIFSTSWSVYRHLFKVHRKTAAQIRRLRESIQSKAFKMNNPPAFYEKRKNNMKPAAVQKISEEERIDQENQAWMENLEGDGLGPRCGGCGRAFERRAALAAHAHTCQPRARALQRRPDAKKIEIQIRKDYNKGPVAGLTIIKADSNDIKAANEDTQAPSKPQNDIDKVPEPEENNADEVPMDVEDDDQKSNDSESPEKVQPRPEDNIRPVVNLPFALQAEKSNLAAFKQRIQSEVDFYKLQCKKCDAKHTSGLELYEHMAEHVKWMRYACKLCNFKHYHFEKLPEHVKVVHKLKGDSDFYFSTVKAIDGTEAMIISRCLAETESADETNDPNETSPESRRPSRCSSDSSRLSDDSSSSSTLKVETGRKRKMYQNKGNPKKKKDANANDEGEDQKDGDVDKTMKGVLSENSNSSILKAFEENSSDFDDVEEKVTKRQVIENTTSVASRRPVRKRTRPKNEDFEYDLSNLLKMEAQGYRDAQSVTTTKSNQTKKKIQPEATINHENLNKDCCGALIALTKKAIATASAHLKTSSFAVYTAREQRPNIFVRPSIPRILSRGDKGSPKKDVSDDPQESSPKIHEVSKTIIEPPKTLIEPPNVSKDVETKEIERAINKEKDPPKTSNQNPRENFKSAIKNEIIKASDGMLSRVADSETKVLSDTNEVSKGVPKLNKNTDDRNEQNGTDAVVTDKGTTSNFNIPAVVPIKFRRQSLELMKPIINKNITDFSKAGMKTKILVIKPINRHNDKARAVNSPLKFQTIKLKDPTKGSSSSEDKQSDQVMVVKVPKVPCSTVTEKILPPNKTTDVENTSTNQSQDKNDNTEKVKSSEENEVLKHENEVKSDLETMVDDDKKCNEKNIETESVKDESVIDDVAKELISIADEPRTTEVAT